jgi:hypothetical protein
VAEPVVDVLRRELRRISPDIRIDEAQIRSVLSSEVLRREALEGDKAEAARKLVARAANRTLRSSKQETGSSSGAGNDAS